MKRCVLLVLLACATSRTDEVTVGPMRCHGNGEFFKCSVAPLTAAWSLRLHDKGPGRVTEYISGGTLFVYKAPRKWSRIEATGNGWSAAVWVRYRRGVEFK
jgi:hypothetical protein